MMKGLALLLSFTTIFNAELVTSTSLPPGGANVCSKTVSATTETTVSVQKVIYEQYRTCCQMKWGTCINSCLKTRTRSSPEYKRVTTTTYRTIYSCCPDYEQVGNECVGKPINEVCIPSCQNGTCQTDGTCSCDSGYEGDHCQNDVNECNFQTLNQCEQTCVNKDGGYECECKAGYKLQSDGFTCQDIDECNDGSHGCDTICTNNQGSYTCGCNAGYELKSNGKDCQDTDECLAGVDNCDHNCINSQGSFSCSCKTGYLLQTDQRSCEDVNECNEGSHQCSQNCINSDGSYTCSCRDGYNLNTDGKTCQDVDECNEGSNQCTQNCINSDGSYTCSCRDGYNLNADGKTCQDVDECKEGIHQCSQICVNSDGSYTCSCRDGYNLNDDGKTCQDVNECTVATHQCSQNCINSDGSYTCSCNDGYSMGADGKTCQDIDECTDGSDDCTHICTNNIGSFSCSCKSGYKLNADGFSCYDVNECQNGMHKCSQNCINIVGDYTCTCNPGYKLGIGGKLCQDVDECQSSNHGCEQKCHNNIGSYKCSCGIDYQLTSDGKTCKSIIKSNIIFLIDTASWMRDARRVANNIILEYLARISGDLPFTRVGVIHYDKDARVIIKLNVVKDTTAFKKSLTMSFGDDQTAQTNLAITNATEILSKVSSGKKYIIIIGSGHTESTSCGKGFYLGRYAALQAQSQGIIIYGMLNGKYNDPEGLSSMVSYPKRKLVTDVNKNTILPAMKIIKMMKKTSKDVCYDPLVDIAVVIDDTCGCISRRNQWQTAGKLTRHLERISKELSSDTAFGLFGRRKHHHIHFDEIQNTQHFIRRIVRRMRGRKYQRCNYGNGMKIKMQMQDIYNKKFTEESGANGKLKIALITTCMPLNKTNVFTFTRYYPTEEIIPINVFLTQSTHQMNDFNFHIDDVNRLLSYLKQQRDHAKVCFNA